MPRQFAPQSLYNMMGKCIVGASEGYLRSQGKTKDLMQATGAQINGLLKPKNNYFQYKPNYVQSFNASNYNAG